MIAAMVYTGIGPFLLGRMKLPSRRAAARQGPLRRRRHAEGRLDDRRGTIVGVLGIGLGLWWADAVAALLISASIVPRRRANLRLRPSRPMDQRARTFDDEGPTHSCARRTRRWRELAWVAASLLTCPRRGPRLPRRGVRSAHRRDGPLWTGSRRPSQTLSDLDWKVNDVVVMPVRDLPDTIPRLSR